MTTDQAIDKKAVIAGLTEMLDEPAPLRIGTLKALVLESLEVIEKLLDKGWSYEDIAKRMQSNGVQIKGTTLRRYVSAVKPKVGKKSKAKSAAVSRSVVEVAPEQLEVSEPVKAAEPEQKSEMKTSETQSPAVSTTAKPMVFD